MFLLTTICFFSLRSESVNISVSYIRKCEYNQWWIQTFRLREHIMWRVQTFGWGQFNMLSSISCLFLRWRGRPKYVAKLDGRRGRITSLGSATLGIFYLFPLS